jgi:FkbM family methyltransferase
MITQNSLLNLWFDKMGWIKNPFPITLKNGLKFYLRPRGNSLVSDQDILKEVIFEDCYQILEAIQPHFTIVDIGAHIGLFSCSAAKQASQGRVLAFEPFPENHQNLCKNITLNHLLHVQAINKAVCDPKPSRSLYIDPSNTGAHSIFKSHEQNLCIPSQTISLTEIFDTYHLDTIDILKLDCEGAEYEILLNTPVATLQKIKTIVMEQHITESTQKLYSADALIDLLTLIGFDVQILKTISYPDEGVFYLIKATI